MRLRLHIAPFAVLVIAGCPGRTSVECAIDTNCDLGGGGICTVAPTGNQWCAYTDESCPSGSRYSDQAGDGLAGECVAGARYELKVTVDGDGAGSIESNRSGLECSEKTCTGKFPQGTVVELSASAREGAFLGWSDSCRGLGTCAITMDDNHTVGAIFGTPGAALWSMQIGSAGTDSGYKITVDNQDNLIAVGAFSNTIVLAPGIVLESSGGQDVFVVKLASSTGSVLWAKSFGGPLDDIGESVGVAVDELNNIYVSGSYQGTVDFGDGPSSALGLSDAFVLKLDTNGEFKWSRKAGGTLGDGWSAVVAKGDAVAVVGYYAGTMTLDGRTFASRLDHNGQSTADILILMLSASTGATRWIKVFGGPSQDYTRGVAIDGSGNMVATGDFRDTIDFDGEVRSTGSFAISNVFLLKLASTDGTRLFSRQFGVRAPNNPTLATGRGIAIDGDNNIVIIGGYGSPADFGCGQLLPTGTGFQHFLAKYTQAGACLWAQRLGGATGLDVSVNTAGEVAATGGFCGTVSFEGRTLTSASECPLVDMLAARFTSAGTHLNSARAGGSGSESGNGVAQSSDGRYFVVGSFDGFAELGGSAYTSKGGRDAFIVGLAPL